MMDTSPDRILKINILLLTCLGQFPGQKRLSKIFWFIFSGFFIASQGYLQTGGMIAAWRDTPVFLESIPPVLVSMMCLVKFINFLYNADKMKTLLDKMRADWASLNDEKELEIFRRWATNSRKTTILYGSAVACPMIPFMLSALIPFFEDLFSEKLESTDYNTTAVEKPLMFHVEYLLDVDKYYRFLVIDAFFGTWAYILVAVAIDSMFMVYVQHACAIFDLIGYRLEHLVETNDISVNVNPLLSNDHCYQKIIGCIIKHSKALEYAQLIESANSMSFLLQLGINMICISFTAFQAATKLDQPDEAFSYAAFTITQTAHLYFESWPSQRLVDESSKICEYTTRSLWYLTSFRSRKLLQLLIMRSLKPCQLTAGGFYTLNLENFSSVVKTSMSYFTVLCSTQ